MKIINTALFRLVTDPVFWAITAAGGLTWIITRDWVSSLMVFGLGNGILFASNLWSLRQNKPQLDLLNQILSEPETENNDALELLHPEIRARYYQIQLLGEQITKQAQSTEIDNVWKEYLSGIPTDITLLMERSLQLSKRHSLLVKYLDKSDKNELEHSITMLENRLNTADESEKATLQSALASRKSERDQLSDIIKAKSEMDAQWMELTAQLSQLHTRLVRLTASDSAERAITPQTVSDDIINLNQRLDSLENSVEELLTLQ